jgi:hypothetical protein
MQFFPVVFLAAVVVAICAAALFRVLRPARPAPDEPDATWAGKRLS